MGKSNSLKAQLTEALESQPNAASDSEAKPGEDASDLPVTKIPEAKTEEAPKPKAEGRLCHIDIGNGVIFEKYFRYGEPLPGILVKEF